MTMVPRLNLKRSIVDPLSKFLLPIFLAVALPPIQANDLGLKLDDTRIYVNGDQRKGHFHLINQGNLPLAVAASVFDAADDGGRGERSREFLVTPPTIYIAPGKRELISVVRLSDRMPQDRESLRYLRLKVISGMKKQKSETSTIGESLSLYMNVFYRPEKLIDRNAVEKSCPKIKAEKVDDGMQLENPTPYWLILPEILIDGKVFQKNRYRSLRLAPFSQINLEKTPKRSLVISCRGELGTSKAVKVEIK